MYFLEIAKKLSCKSSIYFIDFLKLPQILTHQKSLQLPANSKHLQLYFTLGAEYYNTASDKFLAGLI